MPSRLHGSSPCADTESPIGDTNVRKLSENQECLAEKLAKSGCFLYSTPKLDGTSVKNYKSHHVVLSKEYTNTYK